jgi:hypothetical protein
MKQIFLVRADPGICIRASLTDATSVSSGKGTLTNEVERRPVFDIFISRRLMKPFYILLQMSSLEDVKTRTRSGANTTNALRIRPRSEIRRKVC